MLSRIQNPSPLSSLRKNKKWAVKKPHKPPRHHRSTYQTPTKRPHSAFATLFIEWTINCNLCCVLALLYWPLNFIFLVFAYCLSMFVWREQSVLSDIVYRIKCTNRIRWDLRLSYSKSREMHVGMRAFLNCFWILKEMHVGMRAFLNDCHDCCMLAIHSFTYESSFLRVPKAERWAFSVPGVNSSSMIRRISLSTSIRQTLMLQRNSRRSFRLEPW